jgi:hypothetical protein
MSALIDQFLPRPDMFSAEKGLTPSGQVLLPQLEQPAIDEILYPKAEDLLPLVEKLLPPSGEWMP